MRLRYIFIGKTEKKIDALMTEEGREVWLASHFETLKPNNSKYKEKNEVHVHIDEVVTAVTRRAVPGSHFDSCAGGVGVAARRLEHGRVSAGGPELLTTEALGSRV